MKKFLPLFSLLLILELSYSQSYTFTQSTSAYSALTGTTSINGTSVWSSFASFTVPIGFNFQFMGNNYTNIYIEGSSFTRFDPDYYFLLRPFTVALQDKGTASSLSPLSYKVEGSAPGRILKIEWNNCAYKNDPSSTANFQLWLYETSNIIESHIGNCTVSNPAMAYSGHAANGPVISIYKFQTSSLCDYGLALTGNASTANAATLQNTNVNIFDYSLSSTPPSGTVYRFEPLSSWITTHEDSSTLIVSQDPSFENIVIQSKKQLSFLTRIFSCEGKLVLEKQMESDQPLSISQLKKGIYFVAVDTNEGVVRKK